MTKLYSVVFAMRACDVRQREGKASLRRKFERSFLYAISMNLSPHFRWPNISATTRKRDLDVELLAVGGSNEVAIQVAAGNGDVGEATPAQAVIGMQQNASAPLDLRYFYNAGYRNIWSISVPDDSPVKTISDLRGKKIGVTALGSAGTTYGKAYVRSGGLNPDADVTFVPIGAGPQAVAAIQQKIVDAIVFWDAANVRFELSGLNLRPLKLDAKLEALPDVSILARNDVIRDRPKMLVGFARAVSRRSISR